MQNTNCQLCEPEIYEIRVQGHITPRWEDWFAGLTVETTFSSDGAPITILTGEVTDQSALCGILVQISDMNLSLISVNPVNRVCEGGRNDKSENGN